MPLVKILLLTLIVALLTIVTQVGGLILLSCLPVFRLVDAWTTRRFQAFLAKVLFFLSSYVILSFILVPPLASLAGRVPLPIHASDGIKPLTVVTCLLNRHYVRVELHQSVVAIAEEMGRKYPGSIICYLDANFPLFNGFPLVPHLSHQDGKKLDLAFFYKGRTSGERIHGQAPSPIGYGVYEEPVGKELDMPQVCENKGFWQYSLLQHLIPQDAKATMVLDMERTRELIRLAAGDTKFGKIFLEPHLTKRMKLETISKIRFHGCQAVRHDDHIHLQLK